MTLDDSGSIENNETKEHSGKQEINVPENEGNKRL